MRKTVYRLKKFRLNEISLVDRPACGIATVERVELIKRSAPSLKAHALNQTSAQENFAMSSEEINALPDSAFAYIEPGGSRDAGGNTVPRSLRHFPIHDPAHVRDALARATQSRFGSRALPAILAAARKFGIQAAPNERAADAEENSGPADPPASDPARSPADRLTDVPSGMAPGEDPTSRTAVDPDAGFYAETTTADYSPGTSIAGDAALAGSGDLGGRAWPLETDNPFVLAPDELKKYVPLDALPITDEDPRPTEATSFSVALADDPTERPLWELCDLFMQVAANILRAGQIQDKPAVILAAADDFKRALAPLVSGPQLAKRLGLSRWRERALKVEGAMRATLRRQALAQALYQLDFEWPAGAAAIRVLSKNDRPLGILSLPDFQKRGATLSAANRRNVHQARDILIRMCAGAGCNQDRQLAASLQRQPGDPLAAASDAGASETRISADTAPAPELNKLLDNLGHAATTLGFAADEMRKVAEASVGSIRKAEGSAKVLSVLAQRVARLEAQPDASRPQPLRTVEKGMPLALAGAAADDIGLRISELQSQAAELRKRGGDPAARKRLSEIGIEIIRLSNGARPGAALSRSESER